MELFMSTRSPELRDDWAVGWYKNVNEAWENLYYGLNVDGDIRSPRGQKVKETLGCNIYIENPMDNLVYNTFRGVSPIYISKEYKWYKSGDNSAEAAGKLSKFWLTIANPDGTVNSNYGHYIFVPEADGKSVWDKTVEILKNDPDTRQAIIQIPIMRARGTKDTPCTSHIHFHVRDGKLLMTVSIRSNDIILGFPIDLFNFTMWQIEMAHELGLEVGWARVSIDNLHCYEKQWIENVKSDNEFMFETPYQRDSKNEDFAKYRVSDKSTEEFYDDIDILAEKGKEAEGYIKDPMLKFMFNHRKIWK